MNEFITVNESRTIIFKEINKKCPIQEIFLNDSLHSYLAKPIYAPIDVPNFTNSAVDGYAFCYQDMVDKNEVTVKYVIQAGQTELPTLKRGEAARIFTGAMIPVGADVVVMQEKVKVEKNILCFQEGKYNKVDNIRQQGSQSKIGELLVTENTFITTGIIGMLATYGIEKLNVFSSPKIGIIVTGNELVTAGIPLKKGQIYESNSITLQSALKEMDIQVEFMLKVSDDKEKTFQEIQTRISEVDILLLTGGISVGDYDYVKESLERAEVNQLFYKIQQKPGKPLYFGKKNQHYIFALPGNPASVLTCFYQYVRPFIKGLKGENNIFNSYEEAKLLTNFNKKDKLTHFLKGCFKNGEVSLLPSQESYKMNSFSTANCIVEISGEKRIIHQGEKVTVWRI
ncbi:MAG: molybdopterin molybdotransferase MoeA [Apibacter sp.]|nr:molybdopterin molybdotransferase MoeA [Apibacter sp.]